MKNIINKVTSFFKKKEVKVEEKPELNTSVNKGPLYAYRTKK
jgi:hypothetical protein